MKKWNKLHQKTTDDPIFYIQHFYKSIKDLNLMENLKDYIYYEYETSMNDKEKEVFLNKILSAIRSSRDNLMQALDSYIEGIKQGKIRKIKKIDVEILYG